MKVDFKSSFAKDLKSIRDKALLSQIKEAIEEVEKATTISMIRKIKKLKGSGDYFRLKIGNYRLGLKIEDETVLFIRFLHRKDIYNAFP